MPIPAQIRSRKLQPHSPPLQQASVKMAPEPIAHAMFKRGLSPPPDIPMHHATSVPKNTSHVALRGRACPLLMYHLFQVQEVPEQGHSDYRGFRRLVDKHQTHTGLRQSVPLFGPHHSGMDTAFMIACKKMVDIFFQGDKLNIVKPVSRFLRMSGGFGPMRQFLR